MKIKYPQKHKNISRRGITPFPRFSVIFANGKGVTFVSFFAERFHLTRKKIERERTKEKDRSKKNIYYFYIIVIVIYNIFLYFLFYFFSLCYFLFFVLSFFLSAKWACS